MTFDPLIIIALGTLALAAVFAFRAGRRPTLTLTTGTPPGRTLIESIEDAGRDSAGRILEDKLGQQKAREILRSLRSALEEPVVSGTPGAGPTAPAPTPAP